MNIREILVEPQALAWLPWAVSYFFFIGLAFAAVFVSLLINQINKKSLSADKPKNIRNEFIAITIALSCAIVAPIALTADLHQPSRIAHFYLHPTAWSWMAWGALFLPLFTVAVGGYFLCLLRQAVPAQALPKLFAPLYWGHFNLTRWTTFFRGFSLLFAGLILLYTTMEVYAVAARPLWHHYGLMALILFTVLPSALLLCQFFIGLFDRTFQPKSFTYLSLFSLAGVVATLCWLYFANEKTAYQLTQLWHSNSLPMGAMLCLIVLAILICLPKKGIMGLLSVIVALCFSWIIRWILVVQVQGLPKYNALVHIHHLTWEVDGAMGILAMFSLWIFVGIVLWQLFHSVLLQATQLQSTQTDLDFVNGGNNE